MVTYHERWFLRSISKGMIEVLVLTRLLYEEEGQSLVEYGLVLLLIALAVFGGLTALGLKTDESIQKVVDLYPEV